MILQCVLAGQKIFPARDYIFRTPRTQNNSTLLKNPLSPTSCIKTSYTQWDFKLSEEFEIDVIFLRKQRFYRFQTFFKDSLCLQKLTDLDTKCSKRSVKMWATNFCNNFSKICCCTWTVGWQKFVQYIRME